MTVAEAYDTVFKQLNLIWEVLSSEIEQWKKTPSMNPRTTTQASQGVITNAINEIKDAQKGLADEFPRSYETLGFVLEKLRTFKGIIGSKPPVFKNANQLYENSQRSFLGILKDITSRSPGTEKTKSFRIIATKLTA